ncbi:MAG TPA: ATP-binding protein [Thermoleophilia bacterium]|nr:ATP-binding protein [Thermoleophilia bacterium]
MAAGQRPDGAEHPDGSVDARVLGRLFSYMLLLEAPPETDTMADFLASVFLDIPGVKDCEVRLQTGGGGLKAPREDLAEIRSVIPVETGSRSYGGFYLDVGDEAALAPYRPFLANLASSVAVLAENRARRGQLETALEDARQSEERFATMFEQAPMGMALIDSPTSLLIQVNPRFAELAGRPREDLTATEWPDVMHPDDKPSLLENMARLNAGATAGFTSIARYVRPSDTVVWINMTVSAVTVEDGSPPRCLCMVEDISERMEADAARREAELQLALLNLELEQRVLARTVELEAANAELESFAYSVSHDLRAPLRALDGFSAMLLEDYGDQLDDKGRGYLKRVRAADQRMAALIDALLELSRLNRGELMRERLDLTAMAREIAAEIVEAEPGRTVEFVVTDSLEAYADRRLMQALLTNLLDNAWKFTAQHEAARIEVGVADAEGERAFFVRDDGAGFDVAYADKLYGAFQRLHGADEFEGLGIGLATAQRIVRRHGGRAWAEGAVEMGATFWFTLAEPTASA